MDTFIPFGGVCALNWKSRFYGIERSVIKGGACRRSGSWKKPLHCLPRRITVGVSLMGLMRTNSNSI